ncbi:Fe-S oxidoreductase [Prochlorococcus marinus str. MIT 9211]|uniref:Fe-S oxidoreductase n=1 Tax=Prochlorococcus marinus (strain MIT 9211) TaxID=93059 RepID=A9BDQ5_PROM4|nr:Fe-S oxidoreductase [Prochlorococcus marinus str. MIT 9211]
MIWSTLAKRSDVDVRRIFTDQKDNSHKNCDLFGLSLSWELDGPILLDLLEKQGIPLWNNQRQENDPLVFGGGPVLTANPEPLAPFLDVVLLGDGENLLPTFINAVKEFQDLPRKEKLQNLAQIPGVYIPELYVPQYTDNGKLKAITPVNNKIPNTIIKQTWKQNTLSHSSVITPDAAWPNIYMVETVRSCPELCRFCLASYLTLPFRTASLEDGLIPAIEKGLMATQRIGLLGASVTQHPQFSELLTWLSQDRFDDIRLSISSVRAGTVNGEMTKILSNRACKSITIAIESGSERMRKVVNKKLTEEEIFMAAKYALEGGLKNLKLYGMVGLPTEEIEDVEATADLLLRLKRKTPGLRLTLGVSTFVPKAHTPFQWYGVRKEADKRLKLLAKKLKPNGINFRPESYGWSVIQALISRSDRRLAPVIALVRGSQNTLGGWKKAYKSISENDHYKLNDNTNNMAMLPSWDEVIHEDWDFSKALPWEHLQGAIKPELLMQHHQQSIDEASAMNPKT